MILNEKLVYNAIALSHAKKTGGAMLNDVNKVLEKDNVTVDQLLNMQVQDYLANAKDNMGATHEGFGKEWVQEVVMAKELVDRVTSEDSLFQELNVKLMEGSTKKVPVKGKRRRMTITTEILNAPTGGAQNQAQVKKIPTPTVTLTATEMKITIYYTDIFQEDTLFDIAQIILDEIAEAYEASLHEILINGDVATGANTNINAIDGDTASLTEGTDFLSANGARKTAISKGKVVDAGGNLQLEVIRNARKAMGMKGVNPEDLRIVPDLDTYFNLLNLNEVETMEKFGDAATVKSGKLESIDGIKIIKREEMRKATANGTVSVDSDLNTKGSMLVIHMPSVMVGIRKGLTTEFSRYPEDGVTGITGRARAGVTIVDIQSNETETSPVALITNI